MPPETLADRLLEALRNNRYVAVIVVTATIIGGAAAFTNAVSSFHQVIATALGHDSRPLYRALAADLDTLDVQVHGAVLTHQIMTDQLVRDAHFVLSQISLIEEAAKPVCEARRRVAELGDRDTRQHLDDICNRVWRLRPIATDGAPEQAVQWLREMDSENYIKELRAKLNPRL